MPATNNPVIPAWFNLQDVIDQHQPLPEGSVILGVDTGGKPLVLSLNDPSIGSLLILGDRTGANRKHLEALLVSAQRINAPELIQMDIITPSPGAFSGTALSYRTMSDLDTEDLYNALGEVFERVEARLRERRNLPFQLLVLDEIDQLVDKLAEDSLCYLRWILRRGPEAGVWPIATIQTSRLQSFNTRTFRTFRFKLYGKIAGGKAVAGYCDLPLDQLAGLAPGAQGCLQLDGKVISFAIPEVSVPTPDLALQGVAA